MFTLKLRHHFAAAHQLVNAYSKECNDFKHGHNWVVLVEIKTNTLINNMVVDFKKVKQVINQLDHKDLNTILQFETTAENIAQFLHTQISNIRDNIQVTVEIFEAENNSIIYSL